MLNNNHNHFTGKRKTLPRKKNQIVSKFIKFSHNATNILEENHHENLSWFLFLFASKFITIFKRFCVNVLDHAYYTHHYNLSSWFLLYNFPFFNTFVSFSNHHITTNREIFDGNTAQRRVRYLLFMLDKYMIYFSW